MFGWPSKKKTFPECLTACRKEECAAYFTFIRRYVDTDGNGNVTMKNGQPIVREVPEGKCALAAIPEQIMALREVIQSASGLGVATPAKEGLGAKITEKTRSKPD